MRKVVKAAQSKKRRIIQQHTRPTAMKFIYSFSEGKADMKSILGGKGAVLADMTRIGLPVPPGFTVTTETCHFYHTQKKYPEGFWNDFDIYLKALEKKSGKGFGSETNPLLVSVRSGAAVSMPGMMDTILNLGLNDKTIQGLIKKTRNERFCYDAYRRFVNMFGNVVLGISHEKFEEAMDGVKKAAGAKLDTELGVKELKRLVELYKRLVEKETGEDFPTDPYTQLKLAVEAVFKSWNNQRAKTYRKIHNITGLLGTAVNIQSMVFGNMGETSGTGVAFTRNPSNGEKEFYGEFLMNAQGEDVVAGIRTPQKISELKKIMPRVYSQLLEIQKKLELHYKNMQDIEFTIEDGKLFILQSRNGKRTAQAAIKIAVDMVKEKLISQNEAALQVDPMQLNQLLHPAIPASHRGKILCKGLPASPGAAVGKVVFTPEDACKWTENAQKVILVRKETSPEDIQGMFTAQGILTSMGGMTSHAAVVCRGMGKPCVAGCAAIQVDTKKKVFICGEIVVREGDTITLNGSTGEIILGEVELMEPKMSNDFKLFMSWVDKIRKLRVRTNADTPHDAKVARDFGAEGIGLCRTEHMFFQEDRIPKMREMILAKDTAGRKRALEKLLPLQREDFIGIFTAMDGFPVTIRLLDPPLHEFLPTTHGQVENLAIAMGVTIDDVKRVADGLHEINPMLGHRGCRLAVTYPEIYEMQVRAIIEAAIAAHNIGVKVLPEIEVPIIGMAAELKLIRRLVEEIINRYQNEIKFTVKIGTMIELPRACLTADELAPYADFFSFGTNDLTQMTFGFSRDDVGKFLPAYLDKGLLERDPSETIDRKGVGELMKICVKLGRSVKPKLEIGICGEHGGEPLSEEFCHKIGMNYVSCSPYRVPIARLAAAQAQLKFPRKASTSSA
ncbi:pyruvate, phosphate dikinase [Candidatus Peregrinibacteria bacterium]|nr:pyruvate, phosphate dikinase [Candidatus Peregrinibacteria bacterium]